MEDLLNRVRSKFRSATDRLTGRHVPVQAAGASLENLEDRQLRAPAADVFENEQEFMICLDTPGAFPDNTWVLCDGKDGLSIYVKSKPEELGGKDASWGDWYRAFALPESVDHDAVRTTVRDGVVTVHLAKQKAKAPVRVSVRPA